LQFSNQKQGVHRQRVLSVIEEKRQREIVEHYLDGATSIEMTLMYWLKATWDVAVVENEIQTSINALREFSDTAARQDTEALAALAVMLDRNRSGCNRIVRMFHSRVDSDDPADSVADGIAFCKRLFDWSVQQSAEASVALYSLGDPAILDIATREIVALMRDWDLTGADKNLLEIGCGIGRFQMALAAETRSITGIDVSANMVQAARARCGDLTNVSLFECSGRDLALFAGSTFDVVFAADAMPYLYQSGIALVETHFAEAKRVLKPGGQLAIFEFSYRNDVASDRVDVERLAARHGFEVIVNGSRPFKVWDGAAFRLRAQ
jgi:SAM-dependent methyltransferase